MTFPISKRHATKIARAARGYYEESGIRLRRGFVKALVESATMQISKEGVLFACTDALRQFEAR